MEEARACWEKATLGDTVPAGAMYYNDQPADLILYQGLALRKLGREDEALDGYLLPVNLLAGATFDPAMVRAAYRVSGRQLQNMGVDFALMSMLDVDAVRNATVKIRICLRGWQKLP